MIFVEDTFCELNGKVSFGRTCQNLEVEELT